MENQVENWVVTIYYPRSEHYYAFHVPNAELDAFLERVRENPQLGDPDLEPMPLNPISSFGTGLELG